MYAIVDYEWVEPLANWIKYTMENGEWLLGNNGGKGLVSQSVGN